MIGLSIGKCCAKMALGEIDPALVEKIVARTACKTDSDWANIMDDYRQYRWEKDYADEAARIATEFWKAGKIVQPRITDHKIPDISATGIWVDSEDKIIYIPYSH